MATVMLQGNPVSVSGDMPAVGTQAPDFNLVAADLSTLSLANLAGKKVILNIYPSVDTGTCAASTRAFNEKMNERPDITVVCVSKDLPFAFNRFCGAEGLEKIQTASAFRAPEFAASYGVDIADGPLTGLCARAVVAINESGEVVYTQLVGEIADEPDYQQALAALA